MGPMYYIGLDVHKQKISYCVKDVGGKIYAEGWIPATRFDLDRWMKTLPQPWNAALEATMFSGWIYDHLKPHAAELPQVWVVSPSVSPSGDRIAFHNGPMSLGRFAVSPDGKQLFADAYEDRHVEVERPVGSLQPFVPADVFLLVRVLLLERSAYSGWKRLDSLDKRGCFPELFV